METLSEKPAVGERPGRLAAVPDRSPSIPGAPPARPTPQLAAETVWPAPSGFGRRFAQLMFGLVVMGLGVAMLLVADLGAAPWDVLHQGIARTTSLSVGATVIVVGLLVFTVWVPLRLRPSAGTILNAFLVGPMIDLALMVLPQPPGLASRIAYLLLGTTLFGTGAGLYIAAGLGPGPRDGLMTGLAARGLPLRWVRTGLEVGVLVVGWALGGTVGVGTLFVALTLGHVIQQVMTRTACEPTALLGEGGTAGAVEDAPAGP